MPITESERDALVEIVATAVGTDFINAAYLVDTAANVHDKVVASRKSTDAIQFLAITLNTLGARITPAYSAKHNVPRQPPPDPETMQKIRDHLESGSKKEDSI